MEVTTFVSYFAMVVTVTLAEKPVEECVELYLRVHVCASMCVRPCTLLYNMFVCVCVCTAVFLRTTTGPRVHPPVDRPCPTSSCPTEAECSFHYVQQRKRTDARKERGREVGLDRYWQVQ